MITPLNARQSVVVAPCEDCPWAASHGVDGQESYCATNGGLCGQAGPDDNWTPGSRVRSPEYTAYLLLEDAEQYVTVPDKHGYGGRSVTEVALEGACFGCDYSSPAEEAPHCSAPSRGVTCPRAATLALLRPAGRA